MRLISIIPDFHPKDDAVLLARAEALKPELIYTPYPAPQACSLNGEALPPEEMEHTPLSKGDVLLLDYGRHLVGRLTLTLDCAGSHQDAPAFLQLDLAEVTGELEENPEDYNGWLSCSWIQRERVHVDQLPAQLPLERRYAFRYVRLTVLDTSPKYQLLVKRAAAVAESSADWNALEKHTYKDPMLQRIAEASLNTLADCTQLVLEDGPKRDRRLWLGDLALQALAHYTSFKSMKLIRRCLYLFAGSRFPDGRMGANVFTEPQVEVDDTFLADYALMFPIALRDYVKQTGDAETLRELLAPALEQVDLIADGLDGDGLVTAESAQSSFIDWSDGLNRAAALQGVLICACEACAELCLQAQDGERSKRYTALAERLRGAARRAWWSEEAGCFLIGGQAAIHSQVWLTLADAMPQGRAGQAMKKALETPGAPEMQTPYMHHYYLMALMRAGQWQEAEDHLRAYWGSMIENGADTFWECWNPADPAGSPYGGRIVNSYCHAWSCTPVYVLTLLEKHREEEEGGSL